jgi:hypothetical protein
MLKSSKVILLDLKLPRVWAGSAGNTQDRSATEAHSRGSRDFFSGGPGHRCGVDLGANSYVVKPADFDVFIDAMSSRGFYRVLVNNSPK